MGDTATPTLECAKGANNTYSRYTSESSETTKGVLVNSDLEYPIGLLSADELVFAGGYYYKENYSYYLDYTKITYFPWATMTPVYNCGASTIFISEIKTPVGDTVQYEVDVEKTVRPVINLKASTEIENDGLGTYDKPYVIK